MVSGLPWWLGGKESTRSTEDTGEVGSVSGSGRFPWRRKQQPTPAFLPRKSHEQRSPGGLQSIGLQSQTRRSEPTCGRECCAWASFLWLWESLVSCRRANMIKIVELENLFRFVMWKMDWNSAKLEVGGPISFNPDKK